MASNDLLKNPLLTTFSESAAYHKRDRHGTDAGDTLIGNRHDNGIYGYGGDDTIWGRRGDDKITAGRGSDEVYGGKGDDVFYSTYSHTQDENFSYGGAGNDTFYSGNPGYSGAPGETFYYIKAGKGHDSIGAHHLKSELYGGGGNDEYTVWGGSSTMYGGRGSDVFKTGGAEVTITTGKGADTVKLRDGSENFTITDFNPEKDTLEFDRYQRINSAELLIETDGKDLVLTRPDGTQIKLLKVSADSFGLEDIKGLHLYGTDSADELTVNYREDTVYAKDGDDHITGSSYNDSIFAGSGNDTVYGNNGRDLLIGWHGDDLLFGGNGNDRIFGGNGHNTVYGGRGDDRIDSYDSSNSDYNAYGGAGDDWITMTSAAQVTLSGGTGDDRIFAGAESATLLYDSTIDEGSDVVARFAVETGRLRISGADFDDLTIERGDTGTMVTLSSGTEILLFEIDPDDLTQDNFEFI
ncbi:calcium-binding protein [Neptunicoccus cionae]|uniref:Calcium-binding protein n=1 Tax=Neptunicoccus cionae TaxID=2035344 RepID=A0A916QTU1_9RHOB|nr:calcium-binding protein [Amylibacter cionae]GGA08435.1 hypothetical protein GCM10011498_05410 [Amylibacter cionae]